MNNSIDEKLAKTCTRKKRYLTRKAARRKGRLLKLREYLCPNCGSYHLTRLKDERYWDPALYEN